MGRFRECGPGEGNSSQSDLLHTVSGDVPRSVMPKPIKLPRRLYFLLVVDRHLCLPLCAMSNRKPIDDSFEICNPLPLVDTTTHLLLGSHFKLLFMMWFPSAVLALVASSMVLVLFTGIAVEDVHIWNSRQTAKIAPKAFIFSMVWSHSSRS